MSLNKYGSGMKNKSLTFGHIYKENWNRWILLVLFCWISVPCISVIADKVRNDWFPWPRFCNILHEHGCWNWIRYSGLQRARGHCCCKGSQPIQASLLCFHSIVFSTGIILLHVNRAWTNIILSCKLSRKWLIYVCICSFACILPS